MTEVGAPVSGNVWQVLVGVGDQVGEGDELIVLESMKMEVPVEAPHAGKVASLFAEEGAPVEEGDVLVVLE